MSSSLSSRAPRQAAKKASTKFEAQLMSSPVKTDEKATPAKSLKRTRSRPNLKKAASSPPKRSTGLSKGAPPRPHSRKRPISLDSRKSDDEESDLTSLSGRTPSPAPRSRRTVSARPLLADSDDTDYVWVLLDFSGEVYSLDQEDDGVQRIWWPAARLRRTDGQYRVRLFGKLGKVKEVIVETPHDGNVIPFVENEAIRFRDPAYTTPSPKSAAVSPRKRQKLDDKNALEQRWRVAQLEAISHYEDNELPALTFLHSVVGLKDNTLTSLPDDDSSSELSEVVSSERWSPAPQDSSVDIPGELVLARETNKKVGNIYWPAKVVGFTPGTGPSKPSKYQITWMDTTAGEIERASFYTYEEDGFGTCVVGKFESLFQEVVKDADVNEGPRGASPEPRDPPPPAQAFRDLSVREQFVYAKPVLQAILRDEYPPAHALHARYMIGGTSRKHVQEEAPKRGMMDPRDVEELQRCLVEWCLRDLREAKTTEMEQLDGGSGGEPVEATTGSNEGTGAGEAEEPQVNTLDSDVPLDDTAPDSAPSVVAIQMEDVEGEEDPAAQEILCNPPSPDTTVRDSSPALPPPSSSFSNSVDINMEVEELEVLDQDGPPSSDEIAPLPASADAESNATVPPSVPESTPNVDLGDAFEVESTLTDASDVSALVTTQTPPRQIGCMEYEELPTITKLDYCLNVLLPELIIQINNWRAGRRTSVALLPAPQEAALHALGAADKELRDWVFDVKRMRKQKETELAREERVIGGTASRPIKARRR
ncbi:hypothetical protein C8F04DRAFT_1116589 [Mycena alexandri]|uniref:PWWP domain-containing protein n=1 Tax=Mycena alexandri TaxID=1745969 RepID=A0AAD6WYH7_9AGAR|nr:hypothetical protein C8F04DRAFT_1116589 [Mycena alexandri]